MNAFYYKKNKLFVEKISVEKLASEIGTPVYIYSKSKILENLESYKRGLAGCDNLICYAIKANANSSILKLLARNGCGADITSGGELYRAIKAGFPRQKMVYAGVGKTADEIKFGINSEILMFNVESIEELELINKIAGAMKKKVRIAIRVNPDVDVHTHKYITTGKAKTKFGVPYSDAVEVYKLASTMKNLEVAGVHSHIGSQIVSSAPFVAAAKKIKKLIGEIEKFGINIKYVNLGGGLGIRYKDETPPSPEKFVKEVLGVFDDKKRTFIFEPGRSIIGESCVLVASVIYRKKVLDKSYLIVDAGMSDLIRPTLYEAYHEIIPLVKSGRATRTLDVVGPICETGDFLGKDRKLPWLERGEKVAVFNAGAYGFAMASQYNSRCRGAEILVDGKNWKLIRQREKYEDLILNEK